MLINAIITVSIIALLIVGFVLFMTSNTKKKNYSDDISSMDRLSIEAVEYVNSTISSASYELTAETIRERKNLEKDRELNASAVRNCCNGSIGTRNATRKLIKNFIDSVVIKDESILYLFDLRPEHAPVENLFEALLYKLDGEGYEGFKKILSLVDYKKGEITTEDIRTLFIEQNFEFTNDERIELLVQYIYQNRFGFGCVDSLNYQLGVIEEIQLGTSGTMGSSYNVERDYDRKHDGEAGNKNFARDSIMVIISGMQVKLSFLSFKEDAELIRVLRNLLKCTNAGELTEAEPKKITETIDGRRLTISRPPETDAWCGFIRKFDSVNIISLDGLFDDSPDGETGKQMIQKLIYSGANIGVTGDMESGKTTLLRAIMLAMPGEKSIRTVEADTFELNLRAYLPGRNVNAIRVTTNNPEQEAFAHLKKTTAQIMAVGEITTLDAADLYIKLCKISQQTLFTAHYTSTEEMVADFTNARLSNGFSSEKLAEIDAVRCLHFDVHRGVRKGIRVIEYINEVVPEELEKKISIDGQSVVDALGHIREELSKTKTYKIVPIMRFNWDTMKYEILNPISDRFEKSYQDNLKFYGVNDIVIPTIMKDDAVKLIAEDAVIMQQVKEDKTDNIFSENTTSEDEKKKENPLQYFFTHSGS